jgi:hypothetical protein
MIQAGRLNVGAEQTRGRHEGQVPMEAFETFELSQNSNQIINSNW